MRIAITTSPEIPVPPKEYGGTEQRVDVLARRLAARGHEVTLLCGPGSACPVRRVEASTRSASAEWEYVDWLRQHRGEWDALFDMANNHFSSCRGGLPDGSPTVAEMNGDPHKLYPHDEVRNRVYVSPQLARHFGCPSHPVLYNIVCGDPAAVPIGDGAGGYVLYLGTIRPEKGVHVAALACRRLGARFVSAGPVQPRFLPYLESFRGEAGHVGEVGRARGWELLRGAAALAFPIDWVDAGPLVVLESLLVGTPVVACPIGGLLEDVDDRNGVLSDREHFAAALDKALNLRWDRAAIRAGVLPKIDPDRWVDGVLALLGRAVKGERW